VEPGPSAATPAAAFELKRFRFPTGHIDFAGGRYASKALASLLWASFTMFVFSELVLSGTLSGGYVMYTLFIQNDPCQFVAFADQQGNPPWTYDHTFDDGTQYEDWAEFCADYTDTFWMKIGKSLAVWFYRFVLFMVYGLFFVGLGGLGNSTEHSRCCTRRVAAAFGIFCMIFCTAVPFYFRINNINVQCEGCYFDDAAFRFTAYSYFVFGCMVIILQSLIVHVVGVGDKGKLRKLISSEVYAEAGMKRAAAYKTIQMIKNGLELHDTHTDTKKDPSPNDHSTKCSKASSVGTALLRFAVQEEKTESVGGFLWCWKSYLSGDLFYKEGIQLSGRVVAVNLVQVCLACYITIVGVLLTQLFVYLWSIGKSQIDGMVEFILEYFDFEVLAEDIARNINITNVCEQMADPTVCSNISIEDIKNYISGDAIQAFVSSIAYSAYPREAYMIYTPMIVYTIIAGGTATVLFFLYIPSVCRTILQFRCAEEGFFYDEKRFQLYRTRVDNTTFLLGAIFWTGLLGPVIIGFLGMLAVFLFLWQATRQAMFSVLAIIIGIAFTVLIREAFAMILKTSFRGFYRRHVNKVNIVSLALETVTIGVGVFYAFVRVAKILIASLLYISRIDTNLLSLDLNIGPLQDSFPKYFRQELLSQESHKHPWLETLGKLYMMKYRYRGSFVSSAGYTYRLIFALSLLPYLRKYRLCNREIEMEQHKKKGTSVVQKLAASMATSASKLAGANKRANDLPVSSNIPGNSFTQ